MDDYLVEALTRTSRGRLVLDEEGRCLTYTTSGRQQIAVVASARELRALMQLLVMLHPPRPSSTPTLEVAAVMLLQLLDRYPVHAKRGLAHVRAVAMHEWQPSAAPAAAAVHAGRVAGRVAGRAAAQAADRAPGRHAS